MSSETIFFIIVVFLCLDFVLERVLESLNSKHMSPVLPDSLKGIYEEKEYSRFQSYKRENGRLDSWSSGVGFVVRIVFLVAGGFGWYNSWGKRNTPHGWRTASVCHRRSGGETRRTC